MKYDWLNFGTRKKGNPLMNMQLGASKADEPMKMLKEAEQTESMNLGSSGNK